MGNTWPVPAKTPNTPVPFEGKWTAGYNGAITTFVGRALDSHETQAKQNNPMRTLTAYRVCLDSAHNRLYALLGSTVMAYDLSNFFTRLESSEPLIPLAGRPGEFAERYLNADRGQFYAEHSWSVTVTDGQNRLFDLAVDDRGYLYVAYSTFGWGVLAEKGGGLGSEFQISPNDETGDPIVFNVLPVKSGGDYYVIASPESGPSSFYRVGTASPLVPVKLPNIDVRVAASAKAEDGKRIGIIDTNGKVRFFTDQSIIQGVAVDEYDFHTWPPGMLPSGIASDGDAFYAVLSGSGQPAILSTFTPSGTKYTRVDRAIGSSMQTPKLAWGAGYLTLYGVDNVGRNLHVFKTPSLDPLPLNDFFVRYYHRGADQSFITPISSGLDTSSAPGAHAVTLEWNGRTLVNVMANGLWDAYELNGGVPIDPVARFDFSPPSVEPGNVVSFLDQSSGPISSRSWDFGDGTPPSTATNPTHTYATRGSFVVKLTVSGANTQHSATKTVKVGSPIPDGSNTQITVLGSTTIGVPLSFGVQTTGWNLSGNEVYAWNFGDGTGLSSDKTPTHSYINAGPFSVSLQLTNSGGTGPITKAIQINPVGDPIPNMSNTAITVVPDSATVNTTLTFGVKPEPDIWSLRGNEGYNWNFGDGTANSSSKTPTHSYGNSGLFTVTLELTNSAGTGTLTKRITISSGNGDPIPTNSNTVITIVPGSAKAGVPLSFGVRTTGWNLNGIEVYDWNFGDNSPNSIQRLPIHSYDNNGTFSITLQLTNSAGRGTVTTAIQVSDDIKPNMSNTAITVVPDSATVNTTLTFGVKPEPDIWSLRGNEGYNWNFGDGTANSSSKTPTHSYGNSGLFTVTLDLTNSAGTGTLNKRITISPVVDQPIPSDSNTAITLVPGSAKPGDSLSFGVQTTGWNLNGNESYDWDFGDGSSHSSGKTPTHSYGASGSFSVSLQLTNSAGTGTITKAIQIDLQTERTAAILAVVGSVQGAGAFFRTELQIHNPGSAPISGKFVFHRQGVSGAATDPPLSYDLAPGQTIDYPDLLPAMGLSGLGSLDIVTNGPIPVMFARVFRDAGDAGTAGFTTEPVAPSDALRAGERAVLITASDPTQTTLNIGVRTLDADTSMLITVRDKDGAQKGTATKTYGPNFFEHVRSDFFLGIALAGSDTVTFTINQGAAIIYGALTDNKTQDPALQYAKRLA